MLAGQGGGPIAPPPPVMSQALRRKQAMGELGVFSGDPVLSQLGGQLQESAQSEAWREAQQDMHQRGILTRALEAEQERAFTREENEKNRKNALYIAGMRNRDGMEMSLKDFLRYKRDLGKQYSGSGLGDLESTLTSLEEDLKKYEGKDIPGAGLTAFLPGVALSTEGRSIKQRVAELRNKLLKVRSGAAVTDAEFQRLSEEMGAWTGTSDRELLQFVSQIRKTLDDGKAHIFAGYEPEVVELYQTEIGMHTPKKAEGGGYSVGQIIEAEGKKWRVTGGDPNDPDVELVE